MAKIPGKLAKRYARALLKAVESELGRDGDPTPAQEVASKLERFAEVWSSTPVLSQTVLNPMFEKTQRLAAVLEIAGLVELPDVACKFLRLVFERARIRSLPEMVVEFSQAADQAAGLVHVEVTTARQIESEEAQSITRALGERIQGKLAVSWQTDAEILGGMILRYSGRVLDGSLRGRLERIERQLSA